MTELLIRRIVVACDAVCELAPALETATRLAAHWGASLHGVFLEDPALREAAGLPFVHQVTLPAGRPQSFEPADVEDLFHSLSRRAEQALAQAAATLGLASTFSVTKDMAGRADIGGEGGDLVILQATARPIAGRFRLPSRWSRLPYRASHPVLLMRADPSAGRSVVLLHDPASRAAGQSLAAAAELAAINKRRLVILARPGTDTEALKRSVAAVSEPVAAHLRTERADSLTDVSESRLAALDTGLLVIDATAGDGETAALERIAARTPADVLMMR
jgi:hypothetical protein